SAKPAAPAPDSNLYRNSAFSFRYQIPYGWVDRTKEMQKADNSSNRKEGQPTEQQSKGGAKEQAADQTSKSEVLPAVFERPPAATGDTITSAVVIASESAASYPGLKSAEDYLAPLTELVTTKGFTPDGDPYALDVESRHLWRADFTK